MWMPVRRPTIDLEEHPPLLIPAIAAVVIALAVAGALWAPTHVPRGICAVAGCHPGLMVFAGWLTQAAFPAFGVWTIGARRHTRAGRVWWRVLVVLVGFPGVMFAPWGADPWLTVAHDGPAPAYRAFAYGVLSAWAALFVTGFVGLPVAMYVDERAYRRVRATGEPPTSFWISARITIAVSVTAALAALLLVEVLVAGQHVGLGTRSRPGPGEGPTVVVTRIWPPPARSTS
jgi:hypothetical protein